MHLTIMVKCFYVQEMHLIIEVTQNCIVILAVNDTNLEIGMEGSVITNPRNSSCR